MLAENLKLENLLNTIGDKAMKKKNAPAQGAFLKKSNSATGTASSEGREKISFIQIFYALLVLFAAVSVIVSLN